MTVALRARVMEGASLAQAMAEFPESFPEIFRATVGAGEQSGRLDTVLEKLADYAEARDALRQKILAALAYPVLLAIVALAVVAGLLTWVVPQIVGVFQNLHQTLPLATRALMALSAFLRALGLAAAARLVALAIAGARIALRSGDAALPLARVAAAPAAGRAPDARREHRARDAHARAARRKRGAAARCARHRRAGRAEPADARGDAARRVQGARGQRVLARARRERPVSAGRVAPDRERRALRPVAAHARRSRRRSSSANSIAGSTALTAVLGPGVILLVGAMVLFIVLAILLPIFNLNQMVK